MLWWSRLNRRLRTLRRVQTESEDRDTSSRRGEPGWVRGICWSPSPDVCDRPVDTHENLMLRQVISHLSSFLFTLISESECPRLPVRPLRLHQPHSPPWLRRALWPLWRLPITAPHWLTGRNPRLWLADDSLRPAPDTPAVLPALYAQPRLGLGLADGGWALDDRVHKPKVQLVVSGVLLTVSHLHHSKVIVSP